MADVHVRPPSSNPRPFMTGAILRGERYDVRNATMLDLISLAYGLDRETVVGGPNWLDRDRFDIIAKAPAGSSLESLKLMIQSLLAGRFRLTTHKDTKTLASFVLSLANGKHKLKEATPGTSSCAPVQPLPASPSQVPVMGLRCRGVTMEMFARMLQGVGADYVTGRVVDQTALQGAWDLDLRWTPRTFAAQAGSGGATLFTALEQQLGLKLDQQTVATAVLVVDSVSQQPTANPSGAALGIPPPPPAEFDVADIKLAPPDAAVSSRILPSGQINFQGVTLKTLMGLAWDITADELIAGKPKWYDTTRYSVVAKTSTAISSTGFDLDDLRLMVRALLVDRFRLSTHVEDRPVTAYTLAADRPKLQAADPANRSRWINGPAPGAKDPRDANPILNRFVTIQNMTMAQFAEDLMAIAGGYIRLPVVDATGLTGAYDFTLSFSGVNRLQSPTSAAGDPASSMPSASDPNGAMSLFDALQRQVGLKLESQRRSMPVLVIDHVDEQPTSN